MRSPAKVEPFLKFVFSLCDELFLEPRCLHDRRRGAVREGEHAVRGHDDRERDLQGAGGADGDEHGDREDPARRDGREGGRGENTARAEDRRVRRAAREGDSLDLRGGLGDELQPVLRPRIRGLFPRLHLLPESGGGAGRGGDSGGPPRGDHAVPVAGDAVDGAAELHRAEAAVGGDAGLHDGDLLGQDGDADDERDDGGESGEPGERRARGAARGGGSFVRPRGPH